MLIDTLRHYNVILASNSPRRHELLRGLDIRFETRTSNEIDESYPDDLPKEEVPLYIAEKKANHYADSLTRNDILITADTIVLLDNTIYGKPKDRDEAKLILQTLSEKTHKVITGVSICTSRTRRLFAETTEVRFSHLSDEEIDYYLDLYRPYDKAGSYGVQEWIGYAAVEYIKGSFYNVMGLPINRLYRELELLVGE